MFCMRYPYNVPFRLSVWLIRLDSEGLPERSLEFYPYISLFSQPTDATVFAYTRVRRNKETCVYMYFFSGLSQACVQTIDLVYNKIGVASSMVKAVFHILLHSPALSFHSP